MMAMTSRTRPHRWTDRLRSAVPTPLRHLAGHELRVLVSLVLWVARRRHGVNEAAGERAFGHARGQAPVMYGLAFLCVVEAFGMSVLLRGCPTAHAVMLFIDVYGVILMIGVHAASITRPHVLTPDTLRVRQGAHRDLRIPLALVGAVRSERLFTHEPADGVLALPVASTTSLTLTLTEPVTAVDLLGKGREVTTVRLQADEPERLYEALRGNPAARAPHTGAN
ncbi:MULTISPECIES: hypothetical protein [unclassified Streptomyces]|uniref:hypothetical protein n=1 Tax=unclassified Streptomyces TaxID=2593676 RepID=UPI001927C1B0|nr:MULTISPECIES: hypothetical protein [unclassified Streptomyces]